MRAGVRAHVSAHSGDCEGARAYVEAGIAQPAEDTADHDGVRLHCLRELLRGHRRAMLGHMEEDVEHARESAVAFHVTLNSA